MKIKSLFLLAICFLCVLAGCDKNPWNSPYSPTESSENALYSSFSERPKHLDPARSYNANEWLFINQIYEPPLQYHYLKRPYQLMPLVATNLPAVQHFDVNDRLIKPQDDAKIAYTLYTITIKPGVMYQPHPAFARKKDGRFYYHHLSKRQARSLYTLRDFKHHASKELTSDDFVYQIKRLASPNVNSPILGLMQNHIAGLKTLSETLKQALADQNKKKSTFLNLTEFPLEGVKKIDRYTYQVKIKGHYPQFKYWLAMPFFAPMPWEADAFYSQRVLQRKNITLDWYPVGTGPYLLEKNNPNLEMVLSKNPNFHGESYPLTGSETDVEEGLLKQKGKPLPFLDKVIFILEKEDVPYWSKFLQGYYDQSGISANNFDQAIKTSGTGSVELSDELISKGIQLNTTVQPTVFYWGFNMLDKKVGGYTKRQKKLRQAISIAVDVEEYISIFLNGNAIAAQSILPPTIFGFQDGTKGMNPFVYEVDANNNIVRKSLAKAKKLLKEAGYPNGVDPKTNLPLVLYFEAIISGGTETQAQFTWLRKQFKKLGIELIVRATQYNRFQDKMRNGDVQIYWWGWNADYPDPENFLFLLYGKNGKVKNSGENASNYQNAEFDRLFYQMKSMEDSTERQALISEMLAISQEDAPWIWGVHPKAYTLRQSWVDPFKPNAMSRNTIKYMSIDPTLRKTYRSKWNDAILWPLFLGVTLFILFCIPAGVLYWRKIHSPLKLKKPEDN